MLTPHEPFQDPRVKWVTDLCTEYAPVQIVSSNFHPTQKPEIENYTQNIIIKRICIRDLFLVRMIFSVIRLFTKKSPSKINTISQNEPNDQLAESNSFFRSLISRINKFLQEVVLPVPKFIIGANLHSSAIYQSAVQNTNTPQLIICHDLFALPAAVRLKKHYGCALIYDSHEYWAEAELNPAFGLKNYIQFREGQLIKQVNTVITVNPQIAGLLQKNYNIKMPLSVPNAEPFTENNSLQLDKLHSPIRFLLQGRVTPHRGVEELLTLWSTLEDKRAVLIIRAPESAYHTYLQTQYQQQVPDGSLIFADAVTEDELVSAASTADIGIIPYTAPNFNHVYACPNKLSQYMQAGLAILYCQDTEFVGQKVEEYNCGLSYDPHDTEQFKQSIQRLINHPDKLLQMKKNAYQASKADFNWEIQSQAYRDAILQYI